MPLFLHCCVSHFFLSASTLCLCSKYCCLTKFCSANSSTFASSSFSVVMLLKMAKDRWGRNRFTGGKGHQTLPLLVPQRRALSLMWWFCGCIPIKMAAGLVQTHVLCITGSCSLLSLSPALPTPGFVVFASILGHIQVLCGSCAGAHSIGRSAALRQRALLHLWVLCVIPSRRSLLYASLLVRVSHSFFLEICLVNFSIGTWIPGICTD